MIGRFRSRLPQEANALFWEVEASTLDRDAHMDYILERLMERGTWECMKWVRAEYTDTERADFLLRRGHRLSPRERAYWALVSNCDLPQEPRGTRPTWAG
ncbi:MAG: hypothetical protein KBF88_12015 [Polyangiaceae bacterium]|nr:hypothetical protein [Polyangiaceae bacterium]